MKNTKHLNNTTTKPINQNKMSLKVDMMVDHLKSSGKNWKMLTKDMMVDYLKEKFKCSRYMAKKAVEKFYKDE